MHGILKDNEKIEPKTKKKQQENSKNRTLQWLEYAPQNQNILSQCIHFKMVMRIKIYVQVEL